MILLYIYSFLAGIVTILSPCIFPVLPIVLSGSISGDKKRPYGIILGFVLSFSLFTLFLSFLVKTLGISADVLRNISVLIILFFAISLFYPKFQLILEKFVSKLLNFKLQNQSGFIGGILIGSSLGLIWTPCVGPIMASVITLAVAGNVSLTTFLITLFYSIGTAIPMAIITIGGKKLLNKFNFLKSNTGKIQKVFGVIMFLTAIGIYFNLDRRFQIFFLEKFPNYGLNLTKIEDSRNIQNQLNKIRNSDITDINPGQTTSQVIDENTGLAPDFIVGGQWFNSPALNIKDLRGKVVLVDFWTYTCINCIRTLPYIESWHQKYKDKGLVIVGVHTPEFEFEKNPDNVKRAIKDFGLKYPIMQDNDYATWNAYSNHYWPAKYFVDKKGKIRWSHFGEGQYDESEKMIQHLLSEDGEKLGDIPLNNANYQIESSTPELYLGSHRLEFLASPENIKTGQTGYYTIPSSLPINYFGYQGNWLIENEYATPSQGSILKLNFQAKNVYMVMRPKNGPGKLKIYLDNNLIEAEISGEDVHDSAVTVASDRLYKLINLPQAENKILKIEFLDNNLELFAFTFG